MKRNEIKDRLNNHHRDFDREALWNRIDRPKKRKRRFFWFFPILGIGIIALLVLNNINSDDVVLKHTSNMEKSDNRELTVPAFDEKDEKFENAKSIKNGDLNSDVNTNSNIKKPIAKAQNTVKSSTADRSNFSISTAGNPTNTSPSQTLPSENIIQSQQHLFPYNPLDHASENNTKLKNTNISISKSDAEFAKENSKSKATESLPKEIIGENIVPLPTRYTAFLNIEERDIKTGQITPFLDEIDAQKVKSWSLGLYVGQGRDNPEFNESKHRNESGIESWTASLALSKFLGNGLIFSLESDYTKSYTNIVYEESSTAWIEGLVGPSLGSRYKKFDIYNQYSRADIKLNVGYNISFSQWSIIPKVGPGINIWSGQSGYSLTEGAQLSKLYEDVYKSKTGVFLNASLEIQRHFSDFSVGLRLGAQTGRDLEMEVNYHRIKPLNLQVSVGKKF